MATGGGDLEETFEDLVTCKICYEEFSSPKGLPCQHTFCEDCLRKYIQSSQGKFAYSFRCPVCREWTTIPKKGIANFPTDFKIRQLLDIKKPSLVRKKATSACDSCRVKKHEDVPSEYHCYDCNANFCSDCGQLHLSLPLTRNHRIEANRTKLQCSLHEGDKVDFFCMTCTAPSCYHCYIEKHNSESCHVTPINRNHKDIYELLLLDKGNRREREKEQVREDIGELLTLITYMKREKGNSLTISALRSKGEALHAKIDRYNPEEDNDLNESINPILGMRDEEMIQVLHEEIQLILSRQAVQPQLRGYLPVDDRGPEKPSNVACFPDGRAVVYTTGNRVVISSVRRDVEECQSFRIKCPSKYDDRTPLDIISVNTMKDNGIVTVFKAKSRLFIDHRSDMGDKLECFGPIKDYSISTKKAFGWSSMATVAGGLAFGPVGALVAGASTFLASTVSQARTAVVRPCSVIIPTDAFNKKRLLFLDSSFPPAMYIYEDPVDKSTPAVIYLKGLKRPAHAIMANDVIYVTDTEDNTIKCYSPKGDLCHKFGESGSGDGQFINPAGLSFCNNKLLVADCFNHRISSFTPKGRFVSHILTGSDGIKFPIAIQVMKQGNDLDLVVIQRTPDNLLVHMDDQCRMAVYRLNREAL